MPGRVATQDNTVSIARIVCSSGWAENEQQSEFSEIRIGLKGMIQVEHKHDVLKIKAGQAVTCHPGERVRYSTHKWVEHLAVCVPAFSPQTVHRYRDNQSISKDRMMRGHQ